MEGAMSSHHRGRDPIITRIMINNTMMMICFMFIFHTRFLIDIFFSNEYILFSISSHGIPAKTI